MLHMEVKSSMTQRSLLRVHLKPETWGTPSCYLRVGIMPLRVSMLHLCIFLNPHSLMQLNRKRAVALFLLQSSSYLQGCWRKQSQLCPRSCYESIAFEILVSPSGMTWGKKTVTLNLHNRAKLGNHSWGSERSWAKSLRGALRTVCLEEEEKVEWSELQWPGRKEGLLCTNKQTNKHYKYRLS